MSTIPGIDLILNTTFGVEIEMTGITREAAARIAASVFSDNGHVWYKGGTYQKWTYTDGRGRVWDFVYDSSIYTTGGHETACEMNTPPYYLCRRYGKAPRTDSVPASCRRKVGGTVWLWMSCTRICKRTHCKIHSQSDSLVLLQ